MKTMLHRKGPWYLFQRESLKKENKETPAHIMTDQIPLPFLTLAPHYGREDFVVHQSNELALTLINRWPHWPSYAVILWGPPKVGKTHLCHIFQQGTKAQFLNTEDLKSTDCLRDIILPSQGYILEDFFPWTSQNEPLLFHLMNLIKEQRGTLLMTAQHAPQEWLITLKDLSSRILALPAVGIAFPDDGLLKAIFMKKISDLQIHLAPSVEHYIFTHMERSPAFLLHLLEALNMHALKHKRPITIPFLKNFCDQRPLSVNKSSL